MLLTTDMLMISVALWIGITTHAPASTLVGMDILFVGISALLLLSRRCKRFLPVAGAYLAVVALGIILNLVFPGTWGSVGLYVLCINVLYRFPAQRSLPLAAICILALITTDGVLQLLPVPHAGNPEMLAFNLLLASALCWFGWSRRAQYLLVVRLHEVQEQLREQMVRGAELAAERERMRIARDIHDVLSHSLAVLSIQVQAARHLRTRDPERVATKLDDMAQLIRESITESHRLVGLLREKAPMPGEQDDTGASLRVIATTFNERTGIHCRFEESGTLHAISAQQRETLHLALREMLTNAHRHGAARTVWITLRWREASLILETLDDGMSTNAAHADIVAQETNSAAVGHHGLQGMRERAAALGGEVTAGPAQTGGFTVVLRLPYERSAERYTKTEKPA